MLPFPLFAQIKIAKPSAPAGENRSAVLEK